jgi:isoquinoline 1-oxidoreductase alpha subunit
VCADRAGRRLVTAVTKTISVNGTAHVVTAEADTPILWVLRDMLGLTGTKFGCGVGECGACTVLVRGEPIRACDMSFGSLSGPLVTIEGLSPTGSHPVQLAWVANQVPQCGYCQPGMIMEAVALLANTTKPSDADINDAIENICVCGTYQRIRAAIHRAAGA